MDNAVLAARKELLDHSRDANDRYRERAKSLATLTGAAAAALSAGLVLAPSAGLSTSSRVVGLISIILLLLATSLFAVVYSVRASEVTTDRRFYVSSIFRVWVTHTTKLPKGATQEATFDSLQAASNAVLGRIALLTDIGLWVGGVAVVALALALAGSTLFPDHPPHSKVMVSSGFSLPGCGRLPAVFGAEIVRGNGEEGQLVEFALDEGTCSLQPVGTVTVWLDPTTFTLLGER